MAKYRARYSFSSQHQFIFEDKESVSKHTHDGADRPKSNEKSKIK